MKLICLSLFYSDMKYDKVGIADTRVRPCIEQLKVLEMFSGVMRSKEHRLQEIEEEV